MTTDEHALCWLELERATHDRNHAFRQPVVLSVDPSGYPSGRVLTLREANCDQHFLRFHIDRRSPKFLHWSNQPVASAVFYDGPAKWQLRVRGTAELHFDNHLARQSWQACHPMSKRTYLTTAAPGEEIEWDAENPFPPGLDARRPTEAESEPGYANFAVLLIHVIDIDSLHLISQGHRRFHIIDDTHKVRRLAP